jgi:recombination endonuclease VII
MDLNSILGNLPCPASKAPTPSKPRDRWYPKYVRRVYGIEVSEAQEMLKTQEYCCAICRLPIGNELNRDAQIDHDHKTGRVRGIVCLRCNLAIGWIQDDPERAKRIIRYLLP